MPGILDYNSINAARSLMRTRQPFASFMKDVRQTWSSTREKLHVEQEPGRTRASRVRKTADCYQPSKEIGSRSSEKLVIGRDLDVYS